MVWAHHAALNVEHLPRQRLGLSESALLHECPRQVVHGLQRAAISLRVKRPANLNAPIKEDLCAREQAHIQVSAAHNPHHLRLKVRIVR